MSNKKFEIEPLFEETLDFSELSCLKGGVCGEFKGCISIFGGGNCGDGSSGSTSGTVTVPTK